MNDIILEPPNFKNGHTTPTLAPSARPIDEPWRWPLPRLAGRNPIVLAETDADRHSVDIGYAAAPFESELFVPVFAANAGEVSYASETNDGCVVSLVHGDWTTHYAHLSQMFVTRCLPRRRRRQFVLAGAVIGYAAKRPLHVRFELWQWTNESGFVAVDPIPYLTTWSVASAGNEGRALASAKAANDAA
jgi:murein DD-endopeptidase MepM/ murein hydrolase activator NlpD